MSYTITSRDGSVSIPILDGTLDTTTSLSLPGPNYVGYGDALNENLIHLLENFAHTVQPPGRLLEGQLWFDKSARTLKIYTGATAGWQPVSGVTNSTLQPGIETNAEPKNGDFWYDQNNGQLYIYDTRGTDGFKLVGPQYTIGQGVSGAIPATVADNSTGVHKILKLQFGNVTYATISDSTFAPSGFDSSFPTIYSGITFSNSISNPVVNANLIGSVTGDVAGNLTGNVVATTLSGTLTGGLIGDVTGNVVASTLIGTLTGNVTATTIQTTNFSTANAVITGGTATSLTNLTATTAQVANFSTANAVITGGSVTGLTLSTIATLQATNFSTANAVITGGSVTGATNLTATTAQVANFSTANAVITGGYINSLSNISSTVGSIGVLNSTTLQATNFSTANAVITGGSVTGATNLTASFIQTTNFSTANAAITGGNISNITGVNLALTNAVLTNPTATTKAVTDKTTAVATTAFVHSVIPTGGIIMWGGSATAIPTGWQLCDGSNGSPDLRGQFIVGASASGGYAVGATGGANSVTLDGTMMPVHSHTQSGTFSTTSAGAHTHAATVSDPGHVHSGVVQNYNNNINWNGTGGAVANTGSGLTRAATTGITVGIDSAATHSHSVIISGSTSTAGGSGGTAQPHENRPPYYALCYIQKTS